MPNNDKNAAPSIDIIGDLTVFQYPDGRTSLLRGAAREDLPARLAPPAPSTLPLPATTASTPALSGAWQLLAVAVAAASTLWPPRRREAAARRTGLGRWSARLRRALRRLPRRRGSRTLPASRRQMTVCTDGRCTPGAPAPPYS